MNAGAEYVVYRIWGALQGRNGIHPESLLTCLGALAGYACQTCAQQTNVSLVDGPLSVWAFVSCSVRKIGAPLPDIQGIVRGARDGHRSRHPPIFYLRQLWPQVLPIAQRFCSKPAQIPMLFGIALQRAIELLKDVLSPTLSASIAMESAVAMSKAVLPKTEVAAAIVPPPVVPAVMRATSPPVSFAALAESAIIRAPLRKRKNAGREEASTPRIGALVARVPPAARLSAAASLAFVIFVAGAIHRTERSEARIAVPEVRTLQSLKAMPAFADSTQPAPSTTPAGEPPPLAQEMAATDVLPAEPVAGPPENDPLPPPQPSSDGNSDIVIPDS
jgi:hypothetical protein